MKIPHSSLYAPFTHLSPMYCLLLQITTVSLARNINAVRFSSDGSKVRAIYGEGQEVEVNGLCAL